MKKSQIRCIVGNALVHLASILILSFMSLNLIEGIGGNSIYAGITNLAGATGPNIAFYIVANAFYILALILTIAMLIESALGLFGGIFDIRSLNMTTANRTLSIITMLSALFSLIFMIVYITTATIAGAATVGAGPITVFLASVLAVVGAFVAQSRRIYKESR